MCPRQLETKTLVILNIERERERERERENKRKGTSGGGGGELVWEGNKFHTCYIGETSEQISPLLGTGFDTWQVKYTTAKNNQAQFTYKHKTYSLSLSLSFSSSLTDEPFLSPLKYILPTVWLINASGYMPKGRGVRRGRNRSAKSKWKQFNIRFQCKSAIHYSRCV